MGASGAGTSSAAGLSREAEAGRSDERADVAAAWTVSTDTDVLWRVVAAPRSDDAGAGAVYLGNTSSTAACAAMAAGVGAAGGAPRLVAFTFFHLAFGPSTPQSVEACGFVPERELPFQSTQWYPFFLSHWVPSFQAIVQLLYDSYPSNGVHGTGEIPPWLQGQDPPPTLPRLPRGPKERP